MSYSQHGNDKTYIVVHTKLVQQNEFGKPTGILLYWIPVDPGGYVFRRQHAKCGFGAHTAPCSRGNVPEPSVIAPSTETAFVC